MEFKNFSDGYRTHNVTDNSIQLGYNVELLNTVDGKGLYVAGGNTCITQLSAYEKVIGGFDYVKGDIHHNLIFTVNCTESKAYLYENGVATVIKSGMSKDAKHFNAVNFANGAFITNGIDSPFFYEYGGSPAVKDVNCVSAQGDQIRGLALKVFDNRIFMGSGSGLYSCGLGDYTDWSSQEVETTRAGYIKNFMNSSATITAMETYNSNLIIHRTVDAVSLSGTSGSYTMEVVSNVGCPNAFSIANLDVYQLYFLHHINGIGLYYLSCNELGTIKAESEISTFIHEEFKTIDTSRLDEIYVIPRVSKNQCWIHLPKTDYPTNSVWYIYDLTAKCFYPPRITQPITSAWLFNGDIYTGTADGKILKEDTGITFDGQPISAKARLNSIDFGTLAKKEALDKFRIKLDMYRNNNFLLSILKNDDERTIISQTITDIISGLLTWGVGNWGDNWTTFFPQIFKRGKPPKCHQFSVEFSTVGGDFGVLILEIPTMVVSE